VKLYDKVIPSVARDIVHSLIDNEDIEVNEKRIFDLRADVEAIFKEYLRRERELSDVTKDVLASRGWSSSKFSEAKRIAATTRSVPLGDEAVDFVIGQILECLMMIEHVEEVFAEDHTLRRRIYQVFKKHLEVEDDVDREARARLKHLSEGTQAWEVEYQKTVEQIRRNKGLI
jgi:uncharacterized protein